MPSTFYNDIKTLSITGTLRNKQNYGYDPTHMYKNWKFHENRSTEFMIPL